MPDERTEYPITVRLDVHITDGEQVGSANFTCGHATIPTSEEMSTYLETVKKGIPDGFRLMNRAESAMHFLREERGYRGPNMVIPKTGNWFDPDGDVDYSTVGNEHEQVDEDYDD